MHLRTILIGTIFNTLLTFPLFSQNNFSDFLWRNTFTDLSVSSTQGSMQLAAGYKFREYLGIGFSVNQLERRKPGLGLTLRGTDMKDRSDPFGLYYTAGWWHTVKSFDDFKSNSLFEIGGGVRYKDLGLTLGFGRDVNKYREDAGGGKMVLQTYAFNTIQVKLSYLANSYRGPRPFLARMVRRDTLRSYPRFVFDAAIGREEGSVSGGVQQNHPQGAAALHLGLGWQFSRFAGAGVSLQTAGSASLGTRYGYTAVGASVRGEPGLFYYKATFAAITGFSWVDDWEFPQEKFEKGGGLAAAIYLRAGVRLFRRLTLGGGAMWAPRIRGTWRHYEDVFNNPYLDREEQRTARFTSWQAMLGVAF